MYPFLLYIIKVSLSLAAFYLFYKLLCSRDTWHRANRILLLTILALSAAVPFMYIDLGVMTTEASVAFEELGFALAAEPVADEVETIGAVQRTLWQRIPWEMIPWGTLLTGIYLTGLSVYIIKFIGSLVSIVRLIRSSKRREMADGTILVTHTKNYSPFSWMRYIIVSESDLDENHDMILAHERAHIRLGHSWDLLFVQLCATAQWFNPAAWLLKRELESIHEYEADSATLHDGFNARQYQLRLFEAAVGVKFNSMTNNFTNCSTKKRIIMMMKKQTSPWALLKALYVLPVAFIAVAVISCTSPREKKVENRLSNVMVQGNNPFLVFTFEDSTELNIKGQQLNYDGMPDFDYLKPCGLTPENINSISALQGEEAKALYGERGANGAILFGVKGKTAKEVFSALSDYAAETGNEAPLMVNLKKTAKGGVEGGTPFTHETTTIKQEEDEVFQVVEKQPMFPGGMEALMNYLRKDMKYPKEAQDKGIQGRVIVQFVVNKDGSICDAKVVKPVDPLLDAEALRAVNAMPKWTPGKQKGEPVRVRFTLPLSFHLADDTTPKASETKQATTAKVDESTVDGEEVFQVVENLPEYPGGMNELMKFLQQEVKYPKEAQEKGVQGRVIVQFIVKKDGSIIEPKVVKPVDPLLDAEAVRVVSAMPKWNPGRQRGQAVNVRFTLPITFRLSN